MRNFCLELFKTENLFNSVDFDIETDILKTHLKDNCFEGISKNDPLDSLVRGTIIDDLFYGTIWSKQDGNFYIESPKSFLDLNYSGLIIYKESSFINDSELRRDVSSNEKVRKRKFPNDKQVCNFKINVDPYFYQTIFNADGEKSFMKEENFLNDFNLNFFFKLPKTI
ncbi:hypothetical protein BpHYR1_021529 [Brachionus plicatilis]|uniref:Uncharacterized protein n=1 Tax=Brachionus plicatilis TaxID=10195 RepID=A0A3M7SFX9_BRAPC|nr:hypothetical protein BpHYR1_021529 [Brachionus plicatilis]